jgi:hypothetical protein
MVHTTVYLPWHLPCAGRLRLSILHLGTFHIPPSLTLSLLLLLLLLLSSSDQQAQQGGDTDIV